MPLHLLGKKSWNVYNADNIARVKRDEAIAAAHEEEVDRLMQEHDAAKRLAILRGLPPPRTPTPPPPPDFRNRDRPSTSAGQRPADDSRDRRKRKLAGEDDTDRDIRLARAQNEGDAAARAAPLKPADIGKTSGNPPLYDAKGHMNLFAVDEKTARKAQKEADAAEEKRKKKDEAEQALSMRFADAGGRGGLENGPWYTSKGAAAKNSSLDEVVPIEEKSKNVWGRPDPRRKERDAQRTTSSDPLAFMKKAQVQLKRAEKDRRDWSQDRLKEVRDLTTAERKDRKSRRRSRDRSVDSLEGFSLEGFSLEEPRKREYRDHNKHKLQRTGSWHRHRSASPNRNRGDASREMHGTKRSRSPSDKGRDRDRRDSTHHRHGTKRRSKDERH